MNNKYFLTIDVGTKNLAMCLCEYNENLNMKNILEKINIISWEILDVSYKPLYCKQIKNKRAICNCISKFYCLKENTTNHNDCNNLIGYCKTHIKKIREYNKEKINKNKKIKFYNINLNPIYKNNFSTQMEKLLTTLELFFIKKIISPYNYINGKLIKISNLNIYIENQPVYKNPNMKSISVGIYIFFCMKKILYSKFISSINYINATVKTKPDFIIQLNNLIGLNSKIKNFKLYTNRKNFSEDIISKVIPKLTYNFKYLNNITSISNYIITKKKDDLADTLLYQIYIIIYLL